MKKALFSMDAYPDDFWIEGYTSGYFWNGWACPYFTLDAGLKLVELQKQLEREAIEGSYPYFTLEYDAGRDAFLLGYKDEPTDELVEGQNLDVVNAAERDGMKLYPIGASNWCWYEQDIPKYEVQTRMLNGWENVWVDGEGEPLLFDSEEEAQEELNEHLSFMYGAYKRGDLLDRQTEHDFRIEEVE